MANISKELAAIMAAVYGRDVRQSIHDAIYKINSVGEVQITAGTAVNSASSSSTGFYENSLYININTWTLWKCTGTNTWQNLGNFIGNGIDRITKTGSSGLIDTYTILYTDGTSTTFNVDNGNGINSVRKTSSSGLVDTYTISYSNGGADTFSIKNGADGINGTNGVGVLGVTLISTVGLNKTYRMNFSDGSYFDFVVTDGAAGSGSGDMLRSVYDTNSDGIVDYADAIDGVNASKAEINYLIGVTSNIQTQINQKANTSAVPTSISQLTGDSQISNPAIKQVLRHNGTKWVNQQLAYTDLTGLPTIPTVDQTYNSTSSNAQSGKAVASAVSTKANTSQLDAWHKVSGSIQTITVTAIDDDTQTVQFTNVDDSKCYELWYDTSQSSDTRRGEPPVIINCSIVGSGTNCTMTYTVKVPVNPTYFRLLVKGSIAS